MMAPKEIQATDYFANLEFDYAVSYQGLRNRSHEYLIEDKIMYLHDEKLVNVHCTASAVFTFKSSSDNRLTEIINILRTPFTSVPAWMCAPTYRDTIVFFNKQHCVVDILHLCFECENVESEHSGLLLIDEKAYKPLRHSLEALGHRISEYQIWMFENRFGKLGN